MSEQVNIDRFELDFPDMADSLEQGIVITRIGVDTCLAEIGLEFKHLFVFFHDGWKNWENIGLGMFYWVCLEIHVLKATLMNGYSLDAVVSFRQSVEAIADWP